MRYFLVVIVIIFHIGHDLKAQDIAPKVNGPVNPDADARRQDLIARYDEAIKAADETGIPPKGDCLKPASLEIGTEQDPATPAVHNDNFDKLQAYLENLCMNPVTTAGEAIGEQEGTWFERMAGTADSGFSAPTALGDLGYYHGALVDYLTGFVPGVVATEDFCARFTKDFFEVASPECGGTLDSSGAGAAAGSCSMGESYLVNELTTDPKALLSLQRFQKIIADEASGARHSNPQSMYNLALEAAMGDKNMAIMIMSIANISSGGIINIVHKVQNTSGGQANAVAGIMSNLSALISKAPANIENQGEFSSILAGVYPDLRDLPFPTTSADVNNKPYHFWARALLASGMRAKGYPSFLARYSATSTAVVYEEYFDYLEHMEDQKKEVSWETFMAAQPGAQKDIDAADAGSIFGAY